MWHSLNDDCSLFWPLYLVLKIKRIMVWFLGNVCIPYTCLTSLRSAGTPKSATGASFYSQTESFWSFSTFPPANLKVFRWWDHLCSTVYPQTTVMPIPTALLLQSVCLLLWNSFLCICPVTVLYHCVFLQKPHVLPQGGSLFWLGVEGAS